MTFQADLQRFNRNLGTGMDALVRRVCLGLAKDVVSMTPVDTGMARSNYFYGFTPTVTGRDESKNRGGGPSITRAVDFASTLKAGTTFYMVNNLPYIMPLEFGHSSQAPAGMARLAVAKWQAIVNRGAL